MPDSMIEDTPLGLAVLGRPGFWPLAGAFRGELRGDGHHVAWSGFIGDEDDPVIAWKRTLELNKRLGQPGIPTGDRRRCLTVMWSRLDGLAGLEELVMVLAAQDTGGVAISAVGLSGLYGVHEGRLRAWVNAPHPLLGPKGLPEALPGALLADGAPKWLFGWDGSGLDPAGLPSELAFRSSGVHG